MLWLLLLPAFLRLGAGDFQARLPASRRDSSELSVSSSSGPFPLAAANAHLCEEYWGADGRLHAAFFCPRLSDAPADVYCCQPGGLGYLKSCCPRPDADRPRSANASAALPDELRSPLLLPLLAVGLYGGLVLALATADLLHFRRRGAGRSVVTCPAQVPPPEVVAVASL